MPMVYGHKLRWVVDQAPCTECGAPYDGRWPLVSVTPGDKLLCRECVPVWKTAQKRSEDALAHEAFHRE